MNNKMVDGGDGAPNNILNYSLFISVPKARGFIIHFRCFSC